MTAQSLTLLTRALGDRAERVEFLVYAPLWSPSVASYRRFLSDLYGFVVAVEAKLLRRIDHKFIEPRLKAGLLASDLLSLGLTRDEQTRLVKHCVVPDFKSALEALAWLWVIDRLVRRLGMVRRRLLQTLSFEVAVAGSFLRTYDGQVQRRWDELGLVLDHQIKTDADLSRLYAGARAGLECLEAWLLAHTPMAVLSGRETTQP